jgi:hypothetical protein
MEAGGNRAWPKTHRYSRRRNKRAVTVKKIRPPDCRHKGQQELTEKMEKEALIEIVKKRLALEGEELAKVLENPKYQRLFENAAKGPQYRLGAEVVSSKGCHSGHRAGQRIVFDSAGNLLFCR